MVRPESCVRPAGVSSAWVGTGTLSSRPRFVGQIWRAERGVESLFGGSKSAGRSVKRTLQPRLIHNGRAEPLMSRRRPRPAGPVPGLSLRGLSGVIGVQHNVPGGKGPDFGHASGGGKRVGMAGTARSNSPGGREPAGVGGSAPIGKVRRLQRKPWAAAKQSEGRRFHALYDRIYRSDVLWEAWERRYVVWRLRRLLITKRGRNLRAGQAGKWTEAWFHDQGLHQLMGTIRYPKAA